MSPKELKQMNTGTKKKIVHADRAPENILFKCNILYREWIYRIIQESLVHVKAPQDPIPTKII